MKYVVIYEPAPGGDWGAYVPDLPGCCSGGDTLEAVRENVKDAISLWIEVERERGHAIPPPTTVIETIEVAA
jgi:predicted RNase H-like HicB family nuclease